MVKKPDNPVIVEIEDFEPVFQAFYGCFVFFAQDEVFYSIKWGFIMLFS